MSATVKLCVVIDGYSTGKFYTKYLAEYGYRCLHVQSSPAIPKSVSGCFCSSGYADTIVHSTVESTRHWILSHGIPDFVVAGTESGVSLADELSVNMKVRCLNGSEKSAARRNKFLMGECVRERGLRAIKQALCSTCDEARAAISKFGFSLPVVVKPAESTSGDGFCLCHSEEDVGMAFNQNLGKANILNIINQSLLLQEYIRGEEYVVDTVSCNGSHILTDMMKYRKRYGRRGNSIYEACDFLPLNGPTAEILSTYAFAVLDALEIKYGPAHMEIMLDEKGPVLIEVGARLAGCRLDPEFVNAAYGHNQVEMAALSYASEDLFKERCQTMTTDLRMHSCLVFVSPPADGVITSIDLEQLLNFSAFRKIESAIRIGQHVSEPKNLREALGIVYAQSERGDEVEQIKGDLLLHPDRYVSVA